MGTTVTTSSANAVLVRVVSTGREVVWLPPGSQRSWGRGIWA